jgi:hypothetical protein
VESSPPHTSHHTTPHYITPHNNHHSYIRSIADSFSMSLAHSLTHSLTHSPAAVQDPKNNRETFLRLSGNSYAWEWGSGSIGTLGFSSSRRWSPDVPPSCKALSVASIAIICTLHVHIRYCSSYGYKGIHTYTHTQ